MVTSGPTTRVKPAHVIAIVQSDSQGLPLTELGQSVETGTKKTEGEPFWVVSD